MTSAKFSNRFSKLLAFAGLILVSLPAVAQDAGYSPPDMFEDLTPPMVRPQTNDGYIVKPKTSSREDVVPRTTPQVPSLAPRMSSDPGGQPLPPMPIPSAPVVKPPVVQPPVAPSVSAPKMMEPIVEKPKEVYIQREKPAAKTPVPPSKPSKPAPETQPVAEPAPAPEPSPAPAAAEPPAPAPVETPAAPVPSRPVSKADIPPPPSAAGPVIEPVQRDPSQSVIQGPKTMPSLPVDTVEGQEIFEAPATAPVEPTIMERHQQEVKSHEKKEATLTPIVPAPKDKSNPASFDSGDQGALKKTITFQPGQIGLSEAETNSLAAGVVRELDAEDKLEWRAQIKSYATPHGTGISSDRRIALSRALSLRSSLIAQGVAASRIDVLAEGLQSDNAAPGDRIDLYLYGPKE